MILLGLTETCLKIQSFISVCKKVQYLLQKTKPFYFNNLFLDQFEKDFGSSFYMNLMFFRSSFKVRDLFFAQIFGGRA